MKNKLFLLLLPLLFTMTVFGQAPVNPKLISATVYIDYPSGELWYYYRSLTTEPYKWIKISGGGSTSVLSFNGRTGAVVPLMTDYASFYVPLTRNITINGVTHDLTNDATWNVSTASGTVTSVGRGLGFQSSGTFITSTGTLDIDTVSNSGVLSKGAAALRNAYYLSRLGGSYNAIALKQPRILPSFTPTAGTVTVGDSVQRALEKLQYQITNIPAPVTPQNLTNGYGLSGGTYNGTAARTWFVDSALFRTTANSITLAQLQTLFNAKQNTVALTTTGTSGNATFNPTTGALNIPSYTTNPGTVTNVSATNANGHTFTITNPTTTPNISLQSDTVGYFMGKVAANLRGTNYLNKIAANTTAIGLKQPRIVGNKPTPTGTTYAATDSVTQALSNLDNGSSTNAAAIAAVPVYTSSLGILKTGSNFRADTTFLQTKSDLTSRFYTQSQSNARYYSLTGNNTVTGGINTTTTTATGTASGNSFYLTAIASANNQSFNTVFINTPSITNGGFTGATANALAVSGNVSISNILNVGTVTATSSVSTPSFGSPSSTLTFQNGNGRIFFNNLTTNEGQFIWGDATTASNGSKFQVSGVMPGINGASSAIGITTSLTPSLNNDKNIALNLTPTYGTGSTAIASLPAPVYSGTATATLSGVTVGASGGTTQAKFLVSYTTGATSFSSISLRQGGIGYAAGNVVTVSSGGITASYTLVSGNIGLTGVTNYSLSLNEKVLWAPVALTSTPIANSFEYEGARPYVTNSSGVRNAVAFTSDADRINTYVGNGGGTVVTIPHGLTGITTTSKKFITANNAASGGWTFATIDATNVYINFPVSTTTGTGNLSFDIEIKP